VRILSGRQIATCTTAALARSTRACPVSRTRLFQTCLGMHLERLVNKHSYKPHARLVFLEAWHSSAQWVNDIHVCLKLCVVYYITQAIQNLLCVYFHRRGLSKNPTRPQQPPQLESPAACHSGTSFWGGGGASRHVFLGAPVVHHVVCTS
jgi:hypothetical protein